jgi:uncharacterized protein YdaU (DUF1376 family)
MNKAPAFQLYANDFLAGTQNLTDAEVGLYLRLLLVQWNIGSLPNDDEELLCYGRPDKQPTRLDRVKAKFSPGEDGQLRNQRLERERQKQAEFREKRSMAGRLGAQKRWQNHVPAKAAPAVNNVQTTAPPAPDPGASNGPPTTHATPPSGPPVSTPDADNPKEISPPRPSREEVKKHAAVIGMTAEEAERFWHHFEASGWIDRHGHPIRNWQSRQTLWHTDNRAKPLEAAHHVAEKGPPAPAAVISPSIAALTASKEYERVCARIKQVTEGAARDATGTKFYTAAEREELRKLRPRREELRKQLGVTI